MKTLDKLIKEFSVENLSNFLRTSISSFKPDNEELDYLFPENIYDKYEEIVKIGEAVINKDDLIVIACKTNDPLTERTGKKNQYEIAKKILKNEVKDASLFVFYDDDGNFRFSFVKANYLGTKRDFTDFKRYTYFVTPKQTNKTFIKQVGNCNFNSLDEIIQAFSVEPLNKQFYQEIAKSFYGLIGGKVKIGSRNKEFDTSLKLPSIAVETNRKIYQEFGVRLIGRTIFTWFLKSKKSEKSIPLVPESWLSSKTVNEIINQQNSYYHTVLEKLFFLVLNKKIEDRKAYDLPEDHKLIPFLNGGLFEAQSDDFFEKDKANYALKIPNQWFKDLFETLEQYNFTIDENSIYDAEVSIDPEMLGTIFENLLAEIDPDTEKSARKATGSFYTPREIVDYMVEQSLVQYLKTKIKTDSEEYLLELFKEGGENKFEHSKTIKILEALSSVKILDPACGSGAFPMGSLHKIINALHKLDPDASWWKAKQIEKIPNRLAQKMLKEKLDGESADYIRKLGVIQNSIYGVDIQPIASEISKLRSFLSLVIDETIIDEAKNRGIQALPNLEFKFVTANTLIGLEEKQTQGTFDFGQTEELQDQLKTIRNQYLQAYGKDKEKLKKDFEEVQNKIFKQEIANGGQNKRALQLSSWKPFSNESNKWFDPYWMYGVEKFDIVVGNPPYIQLQKAVDEKRKYADLYKDLDFKTFERTGDIYALFYEKGLNILTKKGLLCYITSNKWMRANYGKSLRNFFSQKNPLLLIDLGPGVFTSATVDTNILLIQNTQVNTQNFASLIALTLTKPIDELKKDDFVTLTKLSEDSWIILSPEEQKIKEKIEKIGTPLKDWDISIYRGILTGYNEAFIIDCKTKDVLIAKDPKSAEIIKPILRGRDIKRYKAQFVDLWLINTHNGYKDDKGKYIPPIDINDYPAIKEHLDKYWEKLIKRQDKGVTPYNLRNCAYIQEFEKEKIVYPETTLGANFIYDDKKYFIEKTAFIIITKTPKYLTSLLNSSFLQFAYKRLYSSVILGNKGYQYNKHALIKFPIPRIQKSEQKTFINLVETIISKKETGEDGTAEEQKIDIMVYKLYELSYEEVLIIDPNFNLTKQEYDNYKV